MPGSPKRGRGERNVFIEDGHEVSRGNNPFQSVKTGKKDSVRMGETPASACVTWCMREPGGCSKRSRRRRAKELGITFVEREVAKRTLV